MCVQNRHEICLIQFNFRSFMDSKKCIICGNELKAEDDEDTCSRECAIAASF